MKTPQTEYKREKHARRREEALDAAAELFAEKGYFSATMQEIAERVGLRAGSFYHYFSSKEEILAEVCRVGGNNFLEKMQDLLSAAAPVSDRIQTGIRHHMDPRWRDYVSNFTLNRRNLPEAVIPEMESIARGYLSLWTGLVKQGQESGVLSDSTEPRVIAALLLSMCNDVTSMLPTGRSDGKIAEQVYEMFMSGAGQ
jgi:TetR/AcrR family transcriptional regulator, cholesterol catabolism regulator